LAHHRPIIATRRAPTRVDVCWLCLTAPARPNRITCSPGCAAVFLDELDRHNTRRPRTDFTFPPPADALERALNTARRLGIDHPAARHDDDRADAAAGD
jgi:hypothetical protein